MLHEAYFGIDCELEIRFGVFFDEILISPTFMKLAIRNFSYIFIESNVFGF